MEANKRKPEHIIGKLAFGLEPWRRRVFRRAEAIANAHYRQLTDDHFAKAVTTEANLTKGLCVTETVTVEKIIKEKPSRKPSQHIAETGSSDKKSPFHPNENRPVIPGDSSHCVILQSTSMADTGLEQVQNIRHKTHTPPSPVTESVTVDRDLQSVIDAWPNLPGHVKRTIAVLIDASKPGGMT